MTREEVLMGVAGLFALRSTCSRAHVGVVIAREGRILVTGYNGAPAGMTHCDHSCTCGYYARPTRMETHYPNCAKLQPCRVAVHAEANAIAYAAKYGISIDGAELYTTFMPCLPCAQVIINSGITKMYVQNEYRDKAGHQLLVDAGIDIIIV